MLTNFDQFYSYKTNIWTNFDLEKQNMTKRITFSPPLCLLMFSSAFVEDVRRVLGAPAWMLLVDSRQTRDIQLGRCVQFKIHFYGPQAQRMEQDLTHLLSKGRLDEPSLVVRGSHPDPKRPRTIPYHVCDERRNGILFYSIRSNFIHSFIHLFIYSFIHLFIYSLTHSLIHSTEVIMHFSNSAANRGALV